MKKMFALLTCLFVFLSLAACTITVAPASRTGSASTPVNAPSGASQTLAPAQLYTGPSVILVYGDVLGGYADGRWLTHSGAASLCEGTVKFYEYNLAGYVDEFESSGIKSEEYGAFVFSHTGDMAEDELDEGENITLDIAVQEYADYAADPLSCTYYYSVPPGNLPAITVIADTSELLPVIQDIVDANLGPEAAQAQIRIAVLADIDGDGAQETIVNADNCAGRMMDGEADNLYSIACIIESDGQPKVVGLSAVGKNDPEWPQAQLSYIQNVIDLNGDGLCEIVMDNTAYEAWWVNVHEYDGDSLSEVLMYGMGA